jgi:hypothetical protein
MNARSALLIGLPVLAAIGVAVIAVCWRSISSHSVANAEEQKPGGPRQEQPAPEATVETPTKTETVREPAVAGAFYPGDKEQLEQMIRGFLAKAPDQPVEGLRALICPHAGYVYSGQTAAYGYKQLAGKSYRTVIVLAPSHYSAFRGAYIAPIGAYATPLGNVPLAKEAAKLAATAPFVAQPRCAWGRPVSDPSARPDAYEHSLEVQVPFLQTVLKEFALVPVVFGDVDPKSVADALSDRIDDQTLLVASTDLSHFHSDAEARKLDQSCVDAICKLDTAALEDQEACGKGPVQALVELAKKKGWKAKLLHTSNSGDVSGDKARVVGYAAIAFYEPKGGGEPAKRDDKNIYTPDERKFMLELARRTLTEVVNGRKAPALAEKDVPENLRADKGCFVTLTINGQLRGCIGHIIAMEALYKAVMDNAQHAALQDYRFNPVRPEEVAKIHIEISVLTKPEPLKFDSSDDLLKKLQPHKDGVVLKIGNRSSTFLPQVWEQLPDKVEFLNHLAAKSGNAQAAWREPGTQVSIYHVEAFEEEKR